MSYRARVAIAVLAVSSCPLAMAAEPCGEWEVVPTPAPPQAQHMIIRDVVAIGPDDAWGVGGWSGQVNGQFQTFAFTMHWDGVEWTLIETPQPAPCAQCHNITLWGVDANGPDDVWAAGHALAQAPDGFTGTHMLVLHWDGSSWEVMDTPIQSGASGDLLWDVQANGPDDVWFFGENLYAPFPLMLDLAIAMHWDGSSFEIVDVPIVNFDGTGFADGNSLHSGDALAPDDMWAVGAGGDGDPIPCNLSQIHHWDGSSWEHIPAGPPDGCFDHSLYAVEMVATDDVWAGGELFDGSYEGLALHWDGSNWSQVQTPIGIRDFVAFASDDVWSVGGGVAHWDGASWTVIDTFPEVDGASLAGADASGPCDVWAVGRQYGDGTAILPLAVRLMGGGTVSTGPDLNADQFVDSADLNVLLASFGKDAGGDTDGDGDTDSADLNALLAVFGTAAP